MSNWISEFFKLAKEDSFVKWVVRIVALALAMFILFLLYLLGRTLLHGHTAKIANQDYSFPDSEKSKPHTDTNPSKLKQTVLKIRTPKATSNPNRYLLPHRAVVRAVQPNKQASTVDTKKDTIKPPAPQQILVSAPNYGIQQNGNHNTMNIKSEEKKINPQELLQLYNFVEEQRKINGNEKSIYIYTEPYVNAPSYSKDITEFFKSKGYSIYGYFYLLQAPNEPVFKNIGINPNESKKYVSIKIGYIE